MIMDYKKTLNLPITKFSMRGDLLKCEPEILKIWDNYKLYQMISSIKYEKKIFFLHDGPPYANGKIHLGHAINKILKDIIIKSKCFMGYNIFYIPGWDCHGLPIELKVESLVLDNKNKINNKDFRLMCHKYAHVQIEQQKNDFIRLGILGDWENYYSTMNFVTQANIIRCLGQVIARGNLYRGMKPVHWCIDCRSVLAEAEVEYKEDHVSHSVYVEFVSFDSCNLAMRFGLADFQYSISIIVWNTTPWTLPGNRALAVHAKYEYCLVQINNGKYYIIAVLLLNDILNHLGGPSHKIISVIEGKYLEWALFRHPFMLFTVPVILADYILSTVGSGIVHIAPAHGIEDYAIAKQYNLEIFNLIDSCGYYKNDVLPCLNTLKVFECNDVIISLLKRFGALLYHDKLQHSYPYCWRHNTPIIFRATYQWFINLDHANLRQKCLNIVNGIRWIPNNGKSIITSMLINRPDWCISRQRSWGVPIAIFLHKKHGNIHPRTIELIEIIAKQVEKYGVQAWWDCDSKNIIGDDSNEYTKVYDVLDVWFDSGSTYFSAISFIRSKFKKNKIPDIYLEGADQYRGWFMSSLLLSVIIADQPPCRLIISHGFSVDAQRKKMSKSVGNVISPQEIINKFGADVLRLWIASNDYTTEMVFSDENIQYAVFLYRRIRNTVRFILGNLYDFNPKRDIINPSDMIILDRWIVSRAYSIQRAIISDYESYNFHRIVKRIIYFCSVELGSFYLDVVKDRQYVAKKDSVARRSSQSALYHIIEAMVRWLAPIISFTAHEVWGYIPGERSSNIFIKEWYNGLFCINNSDVMDEKYWDVFLKVRSEVNKVIEKKRISGYIKSSLEADVILYAELELAELLNKLGSELHFGFLTSFAKVVNNYNVIHNKRGLYEQDILQGLKIVLKKAEGSKCARCWHYTLDVGLVDSYSDMCVRCLENVFGKGETRRFI